MNPKLNIHYHSNIPTDMTQEETLTSLQAFRPAQFMPRPKWSFNTLYLVIVRQQPCYLDLRIVSEHDYDFSSLHAGCGHAGSPSRDGCSALRPCGALRRYDHILAGSLAEKG